MADLSTILTDPNYVNANAATKQAIFDKFSAQDPNFANANAATQAAIRQKFGVADIAPAGEGMPAARVGAAQPADYQFSKTVESALPSLYRNTIGGLVEAVSSPLQTAQGIGDIVAGGVYKALPGPVQRGLTAIETSPYNPLGNPAALQRAQAMASAVGQDYARTYGTGAGFQKMMEEDPFRVVGDVSTVLGGGGAALRAANMGGTSNAVANAMIRGGERTNPINMLSKPVAAMVSPTVDPNVRALMAEGITPTTGQILGGGYKRFEEGLTSIPVIGDYIKSAQTRAVEGLNRAAINRSLTPIGETLPSDMIGRDAVQFAKDKLSEKYDNLLPKLTVQADPTWMGQIGSLKQMVQNAAMKDETKNFINKTIDDNVLNRFQGQNVVTGETLKNIQTNLNNDISRFGKSTAPDDILVSQALKEVRSNLLDLIRRSNPQNAAELKAIDTGYANFKRVEKAAGLIGAEEGIFSPAQLQSAVKASDKSKDKSQFATGQALMQDLSETGKTVLGNKLPDSGTPYRSLAALIASGGAAGAGYPAIAAGMLAGPALYSAPGQRLAAAALTARPAGAAAVANQLRANQGIKTGTLAANQLANQQQSAFEEFLRANAALDPRFQQALQAGR
jgi:hypothetical protein